MQRRGGSSNAYTAAEDTCYHFDVDATDFEGALDRFAAFFEAPTFSPSGVERELEAIESEDSKNKLSDGFRLLQLDRSVRGRRRTKVRHRQPRDAAPVRRGDAGATRRCDASSSTSTRRTTPRIEWRSSSWHGSRSTPCSAWPKDKFGRCRADWAAEPGRGADCPRAADERPPARAARRAGRGRPPTCAQLARALRRRRRCGAARRNPREGGFDNSLGARRRGRREFVVLGARRGLRLGDFRASASPDGSTGLRLDLAYELTSKGLNFWPDLVAATVGAVARLRENGVPRYRVEELDQLAELSWRYSGAGQGRRPRPGPRDECPGGRLGRCC